MPQNSPLHNPPVALITGASRGLGAHVARALSAGGYRCALVALNHMMQARALAQELGSAVPLQGDLSSAADCDRLVQQTLSAFGRLDVLINNAGIAVDSLLLRTSEDAFNQHLSVNLRAAALMTRAAAPYLREADFAHVVFVLSRSGLRGRAGQCAYAASKAALEGLTRSLARELGSDHIAVNAIAPPYMLTDMGRGNQTAAQQALRESVLATHGDAQEVAGFLRWLISTRTVSGQTFSLDSRIG